MRNHMNTEYALQPVRDKKRKKKCVRNEKMFIIDFR